MARYKYPGVDDSNGIIDKDRGRFLQPNSGSLWDEYQQWLSGGNAPDPQYTAEEQAQIDYYERQNARIEQLRQDAVELFEFILAIFQVGRDNGAWVSPDFDQTIRDKAAEWIQTIDDYRNDTP